MAASTHFFSSSSNLFFKHINTASEELHYCPQSTHVKLDVAPKFIRFMSHGVVCDKLD